MATFPWFNPGGFPRRAAGLLAGLLAGLALLAAGCEQAIPTLTPTAPTATAPAAPTATPLPATRTHTPAPSATVTPTRRPPLLDPADSDLRGQVVQLWHPFSGRAGQVFAALVADFNAANEWGVRVEAVAQGDYDGLAWKLETALQTGALPDLAAGYPRQYLAWHAAKPLVDLAPYVDDPTWGLPASQQAEQHPAFWQADVIAGQRLGIPALRYGQVLYYNATWGRELGFAAPPANSRQFEQQACAAAKALRRDDDPANDGRGGYLVSTHYAVALGWIEAFGGEVARPDGSGYTFNTPEVKAVFAYLRGLYDDGCAWQPELEPGEAEFAARQGLFRAGSPAEIPYQIEAFRQAGNRDEWLAIPFPSPDGEPAMPVYGPSFVQFPSTPARQMAGWLFLRWLLAPQNQVRLAPAAGSFPLDVISEGALSSWEGSPAQWVQAVKTLGHARPEPAQPSWGLARWALSDAATQLFRYYFTIDQVPALAKLLDETVASFSSQRR